ncbi:2-hydroxychromene-2-carboxylate isomerase [Ruegeria lacuscaerulensis]|uniref:2-hydroxychromene-2-carboxylate isomerase n=1 Tax=Ruegeria lacuscaerulensis TaxID=55218 RepID=UPI001479D73F|nr:2-hydroxychromene-2-carboxylate isomerase [Ruegeria lacuscaerulensis]
MSQTLDFIYDFCSPNAFLAHKVMPKLVADHGVQINYVPVLLSTIFKATNNQSPFQAFSENRQKTAYLTHDLHRYARRRGVSFHMSPHFPINTKFAMRGAVFASGKQWEAKYIDAIFDAIWVHGQKADEITVLMDILQDNELPVRKLREAMTELGIKQQLKDQSKNAAKRGVFGVPTFFASSEMFFGKNSLPNLELELSRSV